MTRIVPMLVTVAVVVGMLGSVPAMGMAQPATTAGEPVTVYAQQETPNENASDEASSIRPGERLTAVIGVQDAEIDGEIENRAFGIAVASAASEDAKASVVAEQYTDLEQRLNDLEDRRAELEEARENGEISDGQYRAQVAIVAAQSNSAAQLAESSEKEANGLPADLLEQHGVNASKIEQLRNHAAELTGPEVAAIAQSIVGNDRGPMGQAGPSQRGQAGAPGGQAGAPTSQGGDGDGEASDAIDRADQQVADAEARLDEANDRVNETNASEDALDALEHAKAQLANAKAALEDARAAMDAGDRDAAMALAEDALGYAEEAQDHAGDAIDAASQQGQDSGQDDTTQQQDGDDADGDSEEGDPPADGSNQP